MADPAVSSGLDLRYVRSFFPALKGQFTFFDNAGGSQTLQPVVDRISSYLLSSNVQLGASYRVSKLASKRLEEATDAMATYMNAGDPREVVMGPSSSMLFRILALCLEKQLQPGDEIIVSDADHEANVSPWMELERAGIVIKIWPVDLESSTLRLEDLDQLMTDRTRLVSFTHCSNVLGTIHDAEKIVSFIHERKALACIDGVAYAPHRLVDVQNLNADFYIFSYYKVYGPHHAVMFGKLDLLRDLPVFNHYFLSKDDVPYKFQPGNVNYELSYGMLGLVDYLEAIASHHHPDPDSLNLRSKMEYAFALFAQHEEQLSERLLSYLSNNPETRVIGLDSASQFDRVPTISFVVDMRKSDAIARAVDPHNIGIRFGDFYAKKLVKRLGLESQNGVIRASLVHYNTLAEVDKLIRVLDEVL